MHTCTCIYIVRVHVAPVHLCLSIPPSLPFSPLHPFSLPFSLSLSFPSSLALPLPPSLHSVDRGLRWVRPRARPGLLWEVSGLHPPSTQHEGERSSMLIYLYILYILYFFLFPFHCSVPYLANLCTCMLCYVLGKYLDRLPLTSVQPLPLDEIV